jgi:hypothetical protein
VLKPEQILKLHKEGSKLLDLDRQLLNQKENCIFWSYDLFDGQVFSSLHKAFLPYFHSDLESTLQYDSSLTF